MQRVTVKEVKRWLKSLEEFRYRKVRNVDARRVTSFINNGLSEMDLPMSLQKKWSKAKYGREKHLADKYQFTNTEAELIMKHHPQKHTHYGCKNWGGRFGTHFHNPQQLGYCFCMPGKKILIGETGKKLISLSIEETYKLQNIHLNALANFQSNNPISGNLNENKPLISIEIIGFLQ